jgi:hypothetical protein
MGKDKFQTILVITMGFVLIGFFTKANWPYYLSFSIGSISLISDRIALFIVNIWFGLAKILGFINSRILLTIIYYFFLVPLSLISRLSKSRTLDLKKDQMSYFITRNHQYVKSDFEKPW